MPENEFKKKQKKKNILAGLFIYRLDSNYSQTSLSLGVIAVCPNQTLTVCISLHPVVQPMQLLCDQK